MGGSTLMFMFIAGVFPTVVHVFFSVELLMNIFSLLLMSKYYKESKYLNYRKLCCCLMVCCRRYIQTEEEKKMGGALALSTTSSPVHVQEASSKLTETTEDTTAVTATV